VVGGSVVGEDAGGAKEVDGEGLVGGLAGGDCGFDQLGHEGDEGTHVDHLDAEVFVET
jgi:hypothetical protein